MKKLIFAGLIVLMIGVYGCKKDEQTYCYECAEYKVLVQSGVVTDNEKLETITYCGVQENQVYMFEHELLIYSDSFTSIYNIKTCNKKEDQNSSQN